MTAQAFPRLGLGGAAIGNLYREVSDQDARHTVREALSRGYSLIDTAPYYGHGLSETRIGAALAEWRGPWPLLSSKVGRVLDPVAPGEEGDFGFAHPAPFRPRFDYSRAGVERSLEGSLSRLGADKLDLALAHDIGQRTHGRAHEDVMRVFYDETLPALYRAREQGLVELIGIGVNEWEVCAEVLDHAPLDVVLLAGRYTLLEQSALRLLDLCAERGVRVLCAGVLNSGILAAAPSATSRYDYAAAPAAVLSKARAIAALCEEWNVGLQAAAVQFPRFHPAVATIVLGARSVDEIRAQQLWLDEVIPEGFWRALRETGLIDSAAPLGAGTGRTAS